MADEIERLRAEVALLWKAADEIKRLRAEIERLRAAGDALAAALEWEMSCACSDEPMSEDDTELNVASLEARRAWNEARRG